MKIIHVVDQINQQTAGGSARVPYQLAQAQARLGHTVAIYTSDYQAKDQLSPPGVELVKYPCWINFMGGIRITPIMALAHYKSFDIIHLHNYRTFVNIIAANKGVPYVLQAHGSCLPIKSLIKPFHNWIWQHLIFKGASRYIADAPMERDQYIAEGASPDRIKDIPVGIDIGAYRNLPNRVSNGYKKVLYLGRLDYMKGCDLLVKAVELLDRPNVKLIIAGVDYGFGPDIKRMVREYRMDGRVQFVGAVSEREKLQMFVDADVYVMPSRYEMWGLSFMEALACGTPVIMTEQCGAAKLLPRECGSVVPFDEVKLSQSIADMLVDNFAAKYRNYRVRWAKQYAWTNIARQTIKLYGEVLTTP